MGQIKVNLLNCTPPCARAWVSRLWGRQQDVALGVSSYRILFCLLSALHFLSSFSTAVCLNPRVSAGTPPHVHISPRFIVNIWGLIIEQYPSLHLVIGKTCSQELKRLFLIFPHLNYTLAPFPPLPLLFALPPSSRPVPGLVVCGSLSPDGPLWSFIDDGSS